MQRRILIPLALALATACSSGAGAGPDAGTDAGGVGEEAACNDYAAAECSLRSLCTSGFSITVDYGDMQTCLGRFVSICMNSIAAPGSGTGADHFEACAQALSPDAGESCFAYFVNAVPSACLPPAGQLSNGSSCAFSGQCKSTFCSVGGNQVCGTCQPPPAAGGSCDAGGCGPNLFCLPDSWTCAAGIADGGVCHDRTECGGAESCVGLVDGGGSGVCTPRGGIQAPCDSREESGPTCFSAGGAACITTGGKGLGTCEGIVVASAGSPCGRVPHASETQCGTGGLCVQPPDGGLGSCAGYAQDGAACDAVLGPPCLSPAKCVPPAGATGTAGTCTLASGPLCSPG